MSETIERILAIALLGSTLLFATTALAQTAQQRAEMQREIAWQKQLKAEQAARATTTQRCSRVGGRLVCPGAPATVNNTGRNAIVPASGSVGAAYGGVAGKSNPSLNVGHKPGQYYGGQGLKTYQYNIDGVRSNIKVR
jgi:hypothetical protein